MKTLKNLLLTTALAGVFSFNSYAQEIKNAMLIYVSADKKEEKIFNIDSIKPHKLSYTAPAMGFLMEALAPEEVGFEPKIKLYILKKTEKGREVIPAIVEGEYDFSKDHSKKILREVYSIFNDAPKEAISVSEPIKFRLSVDEKNPYSQNVKNALLAYVSCEQKEQTTLNVDSIKPYKLSYKAPSSAKIDFDLPIKLYIIRKNKKSKQEVFIRFPRTSNEAEKDSTEKKPHVIPTILKWGYDFSKDAKKTKKEIYNILNEIPKESLSVSEPVKYWSSEMFFELLGGGK